MTEEGGEVGAVDSRELSTSFMSLLNDSRSVAVGTNPLGDFSRSTNTGNGASAAVFIAAPLASVASTGMALFW